MTEKKAEFQISIADAEADFDAVLARVEAGETIILTRDGQPVVCLRRRYIPTAVSGSWTIQHPRHRWPP
jgi:antitoxin (DNA-binding transcriptional repressor) of toxin-antitoxin stability system